MTGIKLFMRKERLYILLLIFVALFTVITVNEEAREKAADKTAAAKAVAVKQAPEDSAARRAELEKRLAADRPLAVIVSLVTLLMMALLLLGIMIDLFLISAARSADKLDIATCLPPGRSEWGAWDVAKVVILFLFFGYMLVLIESALVAYFPSIKNDNLRMVFNSFTLDVLAIVFILYFTVWQYKASPASLGINGKNFGKNVFYGIAGYIATLPALVLVLVVIATVSSITKYVPEKQAVVELLLKEKDATFLFLTGLFAAIGGPIVEELFFRGFMYNAFKKYGGVKVAMVVSAACFAALHAHAVGFFPILVLGIALAYLYEKTGTLVSSITLHVLHNFSMVGMVFLAKRIGAA
jgi:membrane protease YdiL (CAAX protease family)